MIDRDGIPLARKAMIQFGLALDTNVRWEITKLLLALKDIIQRYPMEFAGCPVK